MTGVLMAAVATAMLVAAGVAVSRRLLPNAFQAERWLAGLVVAFVMLTTSTILLSLFGWIGKTGFLAAAFLLFVGSVPFWRRRRDDEPREGIECERSGRWLVGLTIPLVALVSILWLWLGIALPVLVVSDGPIYHLPFAVRWLQDGSLSRTWTPFGELAATYFPGNGEIWLCWLLVLVGDDRLAKVAQWFFIIPTAIALATLSLPVGDRWSAIWPSLVWSACLLVFVSSTKPDVDLPMTFLLVAGVAFVERGWRESTPPTRRQSLVLASAAFGAAAGTKSIALLYSAAPMLIVFVLLRRDWRGLSASLATALVAGGYWYLRNFWETGNPLYPLRLGIGEFVVFDGWYDGDVMRRTSSYHAPVFEFRTASEFLSAIMQPALWIAFGLSVAAGIAALGFRNDAKRPIALGVGMALLWAAEYWFVQPYNTQQRFLLPAMALGFLPLAMFRGLWGGVPSLLIVVSLITEIRQVDAFDWRVATTAAVVAATVFVGAWRPRQIVVAIVVTMLAGVLLAPTVATPRATAPGPMFYSTNDFGSRLFPAWARLEASVERHNPHGGVIGYAGTNLPYYLAGPKLKNRVRYVNIEGEAWWLPHDHFRAVRRLGAAPSEETAFPQWHRDQPDKEAWLRNLETLRVDHFFVARENFHGRPDAPRGLPPFPIEYEWLTSMPDRFERLGPPPSPDGEEPWGIAFLVRRPSVASTGILRTN